jgi:hypothetical protein
MLSMDEKSAGKEVDMMGRVCFNAMTYDIKDDSMAIVLSWKMRDGQHNLHGGAHFDGRPGLSSVTCC